MSKMWLMYFIAMSGIILAYIVGRLDGKIKPEKEIKEAQGKLSQMEKNFRKVQQERDEYKKARDEVFKQVTDLIKEREQTKQANKYS